ncbi:NAC transcription factor 47-like [Carica papaya]|uniref:NAC transcription factor 47-like n=1 Tax=Carica papaya TaxID=3649 RepID=UPI000B8D183D|nr:NAC transcription factor 47-like [Carica papaya]
MDTDPELAPLFNSLPDPSSSTHLQQLTTDHAASSSGNNGYDQRYEFGCFPPGIRFCPNDRELIRDYLRNKALNLPMHRSYIIDVNVYDYNPFDLAEICKDCGEKEWYFFTPRDKKYPKGNRPSRKAGNGYWKATGADKDITDNESGRKTNWIMHEYRLSNPPAPANQSHDNMRLDDWVLCRIYQKIRKNMRARSEEIEQEENETGNPRERQQEADRYRQLNEGQFLNPAPRSDHQLIESQALNPAPQGDHQLNEGRFLNPAPQGDHQLIESQALNPAPQGDHQLIEGQFLNSAPLGDHQFNEDQFLNPASQGDHQLNEDQFLNSAALGDHQLNEGQFLNPASQDDHQLNEDQFLNSAALGDHQLHEGQFLNPASQGDHQLNEDQFLNPATLGDRQLIEGQFSNPAPLDDQLTTLNSHDQVLAPPPPYHNYQVMNNNFNGDQHLLQQPQVLPSASGPLVEMFDPASPLPISMMPPAQVPAPPMEEVPYVPAQEMENEDNIFTSQFYLENSNLFSCLDLENHDLIFGGGSSGN